VNDSLQRESEKLADSWMQHDSLWLRDYLVAGVEDPRINLQSILTRHFLTRNIFGDRWNSLMVEEYRFAAAMSWLQTVISRGGGREECQAVLHALRQGADNAEGLEIPWFVVERFAQLPLNIDDVPVPNYIEQFLSSCPEVAGPYALNDVGMNVFRHLWVALWARIAEVQESPHKTEQAVSEGPLANKPSPPQPSPPEEARETAAGVRPIPIPQIRNESLEVGSYSAPRRLSVLEPACGSANDYRYLDAYGLAHWLDYCGFDLCAKNIDNACALFPNVEFKVGNVFEIAAPDKSFELCVVHDLFEHLSLEGLQIAIAEVCRVTRSGICVGFFQMDEIREHVVRPLNDYYCNLLSMGRTKELFASCGFVAQVIHIGTFLREHVSGAETHNPNAYTFFLRPAR
jgi:SAM-dependent methyltransferase